MATGLLLLLDDVAAFAKVAAASLDDAAAAAARASAKAAGVVIDDAAVTPAYVTGFSADREIPIVLRIARGSIFNKLVLLLPALLALSAFLPQAITPLLMLGGLFLCFEGAEKLWEKFHPHQDTANTGAPDEETMVKGAIRTDLILSAEIMAISLATVADKPLWEQGLVLIVVGIGITVAVYGAVALIVKADDAGVALARRPATAALGRGLVVFMPRFLKFLSWLGMAAMLWVGGGILTHGLAGWGIAAPEHAIHGIAQAFAAIPGLTWFTTAFLNGLIGLAVGAVIVAILHAVQRARKPA